MKSQSAKRYPPELRERAVRMLLEHRDEYGSEPDAIRAISSKIGCHYDTLRAWLRQYKNDVYGGVSPISTDDGGLSTNERQRLKELERENRELRRSNDILRQASAYFAQTELDPTGQNNATYAASEWYTRGRASMSRTGYCPVDILLVSAAPAAS